MATKGKKSIVKAALTGLEPSFEQTYIRIRNILVQARDRALRAIDTEQVRAYWETGAKL